MRLFAAAALVFFSLAPAWAQDNPEPAPERAVTASVVVEMPVAEAWRLWTTNEGITSFFAPGANIDLRPQGPFELYFLPDAEPGQRGSEGTIILGYQENRMLSVSWGLPPYMEEVRPHHTHLLIRFEPLDDNTARVTLTHSGWGEGEAWDAAYTYFDGIWPRVLSGMPTVRSDETGD